MHKKRLAFGFVATLLIILLVAVGSAAAQPTNFRANLSGGEEVAPVTTRARGQAVFQLNSSGTTLSFKLIVANIDDVVAAHIHCAPAGVDGPVGVTLFSGGPSSANGVLAQGTIAGPNAVNGCGWANLGNVVTAIQSGDTYVNVHTLANPGGEIRGQVR